MASNAGQNQVRPERPRGPGVQEKGQWPYCAALSGTCMVYEIDQRLGANVGSALVSFIANAEEGARLILQRSRTGFTIQETKAVQRGTTEPVGLAELRALRDQLKSGRDVTEKQ